MREILFRAKHIHALPQSEHLDGIWVYGYLCDENYINSPELEGEFLVDPGTVCQYTGLTDRNKMKIFEGDICKYYNPEDKDGIAVIREDHAEWRSGAISQKEIMTPLFYLKCSSEWEVIGNIFDNPELIA